ncbi:uncharacterized protein LOC121856855 [Homarus americanus]|uniref:uncharacterized protein LOC121856855 n=1 Tax=Homarus americanus TaxID=6706 RepID=UPI001C47FDD7|nr:uncharacterized protein LOC121856855 [Homarus americanus]
MIGTQERRMSLRRKRSTKGTDATESPVSKKSSPLMENVDDETSGNSVQSQVYEFQRINSQLLLSPRQSFRTPKIDQKRRLSDNTKQTFHTPQTRQQELESQQQHSPDTPFICSQLHGTQECEVVWDCNSPGYSKDDLKRMPGGDAVETSTGDCPVAFVTPAPHRVLFPRVRSRPQCSSFNKNTTAQLDELLDQLSSKDSQLEEDEQGDSKACHHVSTKTTRRASEILDDDLFEDDVLSIIDEVEYSQLEEDEQGDSKACHHVSTKTTRRASEILDDDLFEDDVLSVIDEVESQYGSQQAQSEMASSQPLICTKDEITRKKEAAQRLREEKQRGRNQLGRYRPVY